MATQTPRQTNGVSEVSRFERLRGLHAMLLLSKLRACLWTRFEQAGNMQDLDWCIAVTRLLIDNPNDPLARRWTLLNDLAKFRSERYKRWKCHVDLNRAIALWRDALPLCPTDHEDRCVLMGGLASSLQTRFKLEGNVEDVDEAVELQRFVITSLSHNDKDCPTSLSNLAICLLTRFRQIGSEDDLHESIELFRALLYLQPECHPDRSMSLNNLAGSLLMRFRQNGEMDDLHDVVRLNRESLSLRPPGHPDRSMSLSNLADSLRTRFGQSGDMDDLDEAVRLNREALSLFPHGHPDRSAFLTNLAVSLRTRFEQRGGMDDLDEAVRLDHEALSLFPPGHPDRSMSLSNLAASLRKRYQQSGTKDDLDEAVQLNREALSLRLSGHPDRPSSLINLADTLWMQFEQGGKMDDLEYAIRLNREALSLFPHGHPDRSSSLSNLASSLLTRFEQSGGMDDLDEAVQLNREALSLRPPGHPDRSMSLSNLAASLRKRYQQSGTKDDLDEAVQLNREALSLRLSGHPDRPSSLINLADTLWMQFEQGGKMDDLEYAIRLNREALSLLPPGHPSRSSSLSNLASSLLTRFEQSGGMDDLDDAVRVNREALSLFPPGYPDRSKTMFNIARALHARSQKLGNVRDFEECLRMLIGAADHPFSPMRVRLNAAFHWVGYARSSDHNSTLTAYRTSISLLQRALTIRPDLSTRHDLLKSKPQYLTLAVDAASYAIEKGDLPVAIELLEQGRALLWSQMRGLRTPLDELTESNESLAEGFRRVSSELEALMTYSERQSTSSGSVGGAAHGGSGDRRLDDERRMERVRRLSEEQEALVSDIRKVPGFEDFLEGASFKKLRQVAAEGPVIIVNHSEFRCDALIILPREEEPCINVPLDKDWFEDALEHWKNLSLARRDRNRGVLSLEYDKMLQQVMRVVWDRVVSKVVQKLDEFGIAKGSRIWWCPTLYLSALPFHAAGPYEDLSGVKKYFMDDYISSYTSTLTSLIAARSGDRTGKERLLFVADTSLGCANAELDAIRAWKRVRKILLDDNASSDSVINALRKAEWVHFTCHGKLDLEKPFESSFMLPGGELTLLDIARTNLRDAEFAFLAACHTAGQPSASTWDEALHLVAGMQFCGFRSVVGTMWELYDPDGPVLANVIYGHLMEELEEGECRFKKAAAAVREAALLRRYETVEGMQVMTQRWVNLIHIGA